MKRFLGEVQRGENKPINGTLAVICIGTAYLNYEGVTVDAETFGDRAFASAYSICVGSAIFGGWHVAIKTLPFYDKNSERALGLFILSPFLMLVFFMSTLLNLRALVGNDAIEQHFTAVIARYEEIVDQRNQGFQLVDGLVFGARSETARYKAAADRELNDGTYTGVPDKGAVYDALILLENSFQSLEVEGETFLSRLDAASKQALRSLEKIREIQSSGRSPEDRARFISKETNALRANLAKVNAHQFAISVVRILENLPSNLDAITVFSSDAAVARSQRLALEKLRKDIEFSTEKLSVYVDEITSNPLPKLKAFQRLSSDAAVIRYAYNYRAFIGGGIGLDASPLFILLFVMLAFARLSRQDQANIRINNITVGELIDGQLAQDAILDRTNNREDIRNVRDINLGRREDHKALADENQENEQ